MKLKDDNKLQAIARATYELVESNGLSGLTMPAIARQAGVATGTLYVYFKSKDELLSALYERAKTATACCLMERDDPAAPFRARFQRLWLNWLDQRLDHHAEVAFLEQYYNSPWFSEASRALSARLMVDFTAILDEAKGRQILKNVPTPLLVNAFGGSVRETSNLLRAGTLKRNKANLELAFGICWDGIKA